MTSNIYVQDLSLVQDCGVGGTARKSCIVFLHICRCRGVSAVVLEASWNVQHLGGKCRRRWEAGLSVWKKRHPSHRTAEAEKALWRRIGFGDTAAAAKSLQCPILCDPIDGSPPGSSVHGIFQARVLEWGAIAFSVGDTGEP